MLEARPVVIVVLLDRYINFLSLNYFTRSTTTDTDLWHYLIISIITFSISDQDPCYSRIVCYY